jgi:hypothetical protein
MKQNTENGTYKIAIRIHKQKHAKHTNTYTMIHNRTKRKYDGSGKTSYGLHIM